MSSNNNGVSPAASPTSGSGGRGASYSAEVSGPVRYLPVELGGEVIGYLYTGVRVKAASYLRRLSAQDTASGFDAALAWSERLQQGYADGLAPEEALRQWIGAPEDPTAGAIPAGAQFSELGSYEELRQLANPGHNEPELPPFSSEEYFADGTPVDRSKGFGPLGPLRSDGPGYNMVTESAVRYLPVYRGDDLLGYLWAAETDDAAGFVPRVKARAEGRRAQARWITRLEQCESDGLRPLAMLRSWIGAEQDPKAGAISADTLERSAPSLEDLKIRARD